MKIGKACFPFVRARRVRMLVLDVDGVLTDGRVIMLDGGEEAKGFHVRDGHGIKMLQRAGIQVALLTGRTSELVRMRAEDLGIEQVLQGCHDKAQGMLSLCRSVGIDWRDCAYMGDDVVDLPAMHGCALAAAPADAHEGVRHAADWVSSVDGGRGAVRELAEGLILACGQWETVVAVRYGLSPVECGWPE